MLDALRSDIVRATKLLGVLRPDIVCGEEELLMWISAFPWKALLFSIFREIWRASAGAGELPEGISWYGRNVSGV